MSMLRVTPQPRKAAHWWTTVIAQLHEVVTMARKDLSCLRRRHKREAVVTREAHLVYCIARKALVFAIAREEARV